MGKPEESQGFPASRGLGRFQWWPARWSRGEPSPVPGYAGPFELVSPFQQSFRGAGRNSTGHGHCPERQRRQLGLAYRPAGAAAALGVVGRRRRYITHVHRVQVADVHAQFHGGRAEQGGQSTISKLLLACFAVCSADLTRMRCSQHSSQLERTLVVKAREVTVGSLGAWDLPPQV